MYRCEHTQSLGAGFEMWIKENNFNCDRFSLNPTRTLLGHDGKIKTDEGFDFILLHANVFVYKCRLNNL